MSSSSLSLLQYLRVTMAALREDKRTDTELLARFASTRDEIAFAALVVRHGQMVWSVCRQILGDTHDIEDAFQATFMSLSHKANKIHIESLAGWLHQVARQAALDIQRSAGSRRKLQEQLQALARSEPLRVDAERNETYAVLHEELDGLTEKLRVPLVLHFLEGKTQVEIAQIVGVSDRAVRKRLERGKSILQERLSQRGVCVGTATLATLLERTSAQAAISSDLIARTVGSSLAFRVGTLSGATAELARHVLKSLPYGMGWVMKTCLVALLCVGGLGAGAYVWQAATLPLPRPRTDGPRAVKVKEDPSPEGDKDGVSKTRLDLYGDPLPPHALQRLGTVRFRPGRIQQLEFTPDGKGFITMSNRLSMHTIGIWDKDTGKLLRRFGDSPNFRCGSINAHGRIVTGWQFYPGKSENILCLWEVATGKLIRQFRGKSTRRSDNYAISPNGKFLAADLEGKFAMWDISTGTALWEEKLQEGEFVEAVTISSDSNSIASSFFRRDQKGNEICIVRLWETRTGKLLRTWKGDLAKKRVCRLKFSPDGSRLIAMTYEKQHRMVHLLDPITGKIIPLSETNGEIVCSPTGMIVATYKYREGIWLWDMATGKLLRHLPEFRQVGGCSLVVFSPDGKILAGTTETPCGNTFWDVATGKVLRHCENSKQTWANLAFSPDGKILAGMEGPALSCWEVATGKKLPRPRDYEGFINSVAFTRDGKSVVSFECNEHHGAIHVWDAQSGQERSAFPSGTIPRSLDILGTGLSPDNKILAFGRGSKAIDIWDAVRGQKLQRLEKSHKAHIISSDRRCLIYGYEAQKNVDDFMTILWELPTGRRLPQQFPGIGLALSPDGTILVTQPYESGRGYVPGVCSLWEIATGKKIGEIKVRDDRFSLAFSLNGQALLITDSRWVNSRKTTYKIQLYPLHRDKHGVRIGVARTVLEINDDGGVGNLTLSPDGKMLAALGRDWSDGIVYLWETATGKERGRFQGHSDEVKFLAFSPDGRRLASGSADTTILIWDVTGRLDDQARLRPSHLSAKQQKECWADLADADALRANQAIWTLVAAGQPTVVLMAKRLRPVPAVAVKTLTQLVADLDSDTYAVHQTARRKLEALGDIAEPHLHQASEKQPSLQLRRSIDHLLTLIEEQRAKPSSETLRMLRAIEVLEQIGTPEARKLLEALSAGAPGARQTEEAKASVNRLARRAAQP